MIDDEIRRALKLLETLMTISGLNRQDLDRRLGQGRGYASQVLTGRVELKYRHILAFLEVVDVEFVGGGKHRVLLEAYGYRWYRVGGLGHWLHRERA